jgi:hypothetical protein
MLAGQFFDRLAQAVSGETPAPTPGAAQAIPAWLWVAGAIALIAVLSILWLAI